MLGAVDLEDEFIRDVLPAYRENGPERSLEKIDSLFQSWERLELSGHMRGLAETALIINPKRPLIFVNAEICTRMPPDRRTVHTNYHIDDYSVPIPIEICVPPFLDRLSPLQTFFDTRHNINTKKRYVHPNLLLELVSMIEEKSTIIKAIRPMKGIPQSGPILLAQGPLSLQ